MSKLLRCALLFLAFVNISNAGEGKNSGTSTGGGELPYKKISSVKVLN